MPAGSRVFIKPNIVFRTRAVNFPKHGVITTSRVVEDMVLMLKEHGVREIMIGDGSVLGEGVVVRFNTDILGADYVVNLPVLKNPFDDHVHPHRRDLYQRKKALELLEEFKTFVPVLPMPETAGNAYGLIRASLEPQ